MADAEDKTGDRSRSADQQVVCWRPWPCESCRGGSTALGFLVRCFGSNPEVPQVDRNGQIDWFKKWEADRLLEWIQSCEHTRWLDMSLPRLDEGSEHLVLFDEQTSEVVKVTLPGTYGDCGRGGRQQNPARISHHAGPHRGPRQTRQGTNSRLRAGLSQPQAGRGRSQGVGQAADGRRGAGQGLCRQDGSALRLRHQWPWHLRHRHGDGQGR